MRDAGQSRTTANTSAPLFLFMRAARHNSLQHASYGKGLRHYNRKRWRVKLAMVRPAQARWAHFRPGQCLKRLMIVSKHGHRSSPSRGAKLGQTGQQDHQLLLVKVPEISKIALSTQAAIISGNFAYKGSCNHKREEV